MSTVRPPALPDPVAPTRPRFGRVSVNLQGRVMRFVAEGPFDADIIAAVRRAVQSTLRRHPGVQRFVQITEYRSSAAWSEAALAELRAFIDEQVSRGVLPYASLLVAAPDLPGRADLDKVQALMAPSRPVRICTDLDQAWQVANEVLRAAGHPEQQGPDLG